MRVFLLIFMDHGIVLIFLRQDVYSNVTTVASVLSIIVVATAISVIDAMMLGGLLLGTNLFRLTFSAYTTFADRRMS